MPHTCSITVFLEGSFIRDLCLIRYDYTVFDNCAITKEEQHTNTVNTLILSYINYSLGCEIQ